MKNASLNSDPQFIWSFENQNPFIRTAVQLGSIHNLSDTDLVTHQ